MKSLFCHNNKCSLQLFITDEIKTTSMSNPFLICHLLTLRRAKIFEATSCQHAIKLLFSSMDTNTVNYVLIIGLENIFTMRSR